MQEHPAFLGHDLAAGEAAASEEALEPRFRELFDAATVGVFASNPHGTILSCNGAFTKIFGFASVDEAVGSNGLVLHTSLGRRARILKTLREKGHAEYRGAMRRMDGTPIEILAAVTGSFDRDGALVELRGFVFDVTAKTKADAVRADRDRRFRSVFVDAADPMLVLNDDRRIVDANRAACVLFGLDEEGLKVRSLDDLVLDQASKFDEAWSELLAIGEAKREHRVKSDGGSARLVECTYRAAVETGHFLWIARDITERRQLEERLVQSEKIESIGRLAGGIAHDFNNLLTAILGYTELVIGNLDPGDRNRADLVEIQKAGQRAATLTQQLLAYSRKQVLQPKEVDLNDTVSNLRGMLERLVRENTTLKIDPSPEPAFVKVDPTQLEQVILNLVLNARDALPTGGEIRVEVARVHLSEVDLPSDHSTHAREFVRLRISDNGDGIAPEVRAHLFEPFYTTKKLGKGTGLGLSAVYGIVRQSGGFISVESEPGRGAAFTMHFPAVGPKPVMPRVPAPAPTTAHETVLLVEDDDAVRLIAASALKRQGYNVLEAATPLIACEIFEQRGNDIALLLTDIIMPEMNGPTLAQRLVAKRPELRVLFMSGYADVTSPFDTDNANIAFLSKPFHASTLAAKVREVLSRPRQGS
jgi:two-component system cell cycle sensor histidine kinase/response regulator CckA